jgi:hypothetical protein
MFKSLPGGSPSPKVNFYHVFAEAMRRGSKKTKQIIGEMNDEEGGTCALGAALLTLNVECIYELPTAYRELLYKGKVRSPATQGFKHLIDVIIELNDDYGWKREKIADWIELLGNLPGPGVHSGRKQQ